MATENEPPPFPARRFVGLGCNFTLKGRELYGTVKNAAYIGRTNRGLIPDYLLTIQGRSGQTVEVSLVESHARFPSL